jgi:hypothetical protein
LSCWPDLPPPEWLRYFPLNIGRRQCQIAPIALGELRQQSTFVSAAPPPLQDSQEARRRKAAMPSIPK